MTADQILNVLSQGGRLRVSAGTTDDPKAEWSVQKRGKRGNWLTARLVPNAAGQAVAELLVRQPGMFWDYFYVLKPTTKATP